MNDAGAGCAGFAVTLHNSLSIDLDGHADIDLMNGAVYHGSNLLKANGELTLHTVGCRTGTGNRPTGNYKYWARKFPQDCEAPRTQPTDSTTDEPRQRDLAAEQSKREEAERQSGATREPAETNAEENQQIVDRTVQDSDAAKADADRTGAAYATAMAGLAEAGGTNGPKKQWLNRLFHWGIGFGGAYLPLFVDKSASSMASNAIAAGPRGELGLWPFVTRWGSVGIHATVFGGYVPGYGDAALDLNVGVRAIVGPERYVAFLARVGTGYRYGVDSSDGFGQAAAAYSGSVSTSYTETAIGGHACFSAFDKAPFCQVGLDFWVVNQQSDSFMGKSGTPTLYEFELSDRGWASAFVQFATTYPLANLPEHPVNGSTTGTYVLVGFRVAAGDDFSTWDSHPIKDEQ